MRRNLKKQLNEIFESLLNFTGKIIVRQAGFHDGVIIFFNLWKDRANGEGLAANTLVSKHAFNLVEDDGISESIVLGGMGKNSIAV